MRQSGWNRGNYPAPGYYPGGGFFKPKICKNPRRVIVNFMASETLKEQKMIKIALKDGSVKEFEAGVRPIDVANSISEGFARQCVAAEINGRVAGLTEEITADSELNLLKFGDKGGADVYRHTASHIMANAIKRLYKGAQLAIGPSIETGFYYDFDIENTFSEADFEKIEAEMNKIIKEDNEIVRFVLPRNEAIALMKELDEPYKVELIEELPEGEEISFYKQGDFTDLCAGPHLPSTGRVKSFKLMQVAGAYWRGSEKNKMLQRIYGTAFDNKKELKKYVVALEEAIKRDHNKLGRELEFFTTSDVIGQGLPLLMPKGAKVIQILQRFVEDEEERRGYQLTKTPFMAKSDLYKMSGHWDHYREGMFVMGNEEAGDELLALRPMTCPFQFMIYNAGLKSYRDLPVRYNETSPLFRNEASGEMHGLIRIRQFTLAEGHIICTPEQLEQEFLDVIDLLNYTMEVLGIQDDVKYRFSKWDPANTEKYINNPNAWEESQNKMRKILDKIDIDYVEADGEAAFYGPKLDIQFKNVFGKEDTLITVQIDFALPKRFDMQYIDSNGEKQYPYVIHRSSIGCYERTLALLIEKYAGSMPVWLAPIQAKVLSIAEAHSDYTYEVKEALEAAGVRVEADIRNEKLGYKIREARNQRVPYILVVGDKEIADRAVAVRSRKDGDIGAIALDDFIAMVKKDNDERVIW